jgi:hypothetical protein
MATQSIVSPRSSSAPKIMTWEFHFHECECGAVVFCSNEPCWRFNAFKCRISVPWKWRCANCKNGGAR